MRAIVPIREWRCQDNDQVLLHERILFSVYSAALKCQAKMLPFGVNRRLQPAGLEKKREESVKPTCFMSKPTLVPQTNHSQYSSPIKASNLIVKSKSSLPIQLNNSTVEFHVLSRRKKSLQSYCSVDFDFLALMQFDMTFDVMLRDSSSFGKLTDSCLTYQNISFSLLPVTQA